VFIYVGVADLAHKLSLLLKCGMTLTEALHHAAAGVRDAHVGLACAQLARSVAVGKPLPEAMSESDACPRLLISLASFGASHNTLPEALDIAGESYEERARLQTTYLCSVLPTILLLLTATMVIFVIGAVMAPLIQLILSLNG
jgi:type II secretory pathway component PulF